MERVSVSQSHIWC